ncbi:MAG: hypothetical protein ACLRPU_00225 [Enterococcus hulanensis]
MRNKKRSVLLGFLLLIGICLIQGSDGHADQIDATMVNYKALVVPGEPDWYSEVPAVLPFTKETKELAVPVTITVTEGQEKRADAHVMVQVRSTNGYQLKNGSEAAVTYHLLNDARHPLQETTDEQILGIVPLEDGTIASTARLVEDAVKTGKYVDTLIYSFTLSTNHTPENTKE